MGVLLLTGGGRRVMVGGRVMGGRRVWLLGGRRVVPARRVMLM